MTTTQPTKICSCCKRELPFDAFAMKIPAKGLRQSRCRECAKASSRAHYEANKAAVIAKSVAKKSDQKGLLREMVAGMLDGKCCTRCTSTDKLTFKRNPDYEGPRVSAAVNAGLALETVMTSIENSAIVCKQCDHQDCATGLKAFTKAKHAGEAYIGSPLTRAEQKDLNTRSVQDLRKGRYEAGRLFA